MWTWITRSITSSKNLVQVEKRSDLSLHFSSVTFLDFWTICPYCLDHRRCPWNTNWEVVRRNVICWLGPRIRTALNVYGIIVCWPQILWRPLGLCRQVGSRIITSTPWTQICLQFSRPFTTDLTSYASKAPVIVRFFDCWNDIWPAHDQFPERLKNALLQTNWHLSCPAVLC
jgi:hypothetical protein